MPGARPEGHSPNDFGRPEDDAITGESGADNHHRGHADHYHRTPADDHSPGVADSESDAESEPDDHGDCTARTPATTGDGLPGGGMTGQWGAST